MATNCLAITKAKHRCTRKTSSFDILCYQHKKQFNKSKTNSNIYDILNIVEVFEDKLNHTNIFLCNKDLYFKYLGTTSCYKYFKQGYLNHKLLPLLYLDIPQDVNIIDIMFNTLYYVIICKSSQKQFEFITTLEDLINSLNNMYKDYDKIYIYPYINVNNILYVQQ